jgi:hypothetical protein
LAAPLPVAQGGTGTTTPGIVAGTNVTVSGTWPNQTVNSTGGGITAAGSGLIQLLQFKAATSASGTTAVTFTSSVGQGSTIVVEYVGVNNVGVSDSAGNVYTQYNPQNWSTFVYLSMFASVNVPGGTALTITAAGTGSFGQLNIYEYSNVAAVDGSISATNAGA